MSKEMLTLYQGLLKEAQEYRVSLSRLARIKRKMESGNNNFCKVIPSLIIDIEIQIKRSVNDEQKKKEALTSLNIRRSQFLAMKEEEAWRKGK